jgi:hypothetical protein
MAASQIWLGSLLLVNQPAFSQIYLTQIEFDTYSKENRLDDHEKVKNNSPDVHETAGNTLEQNI